MRAADRTSRTDRPRRGRRALVVAAVAVAGLGLTMTVADPASGEGWRAKAVLRDVGGQRVGVVRFQGEEGGTDVRVQLTGIAVGTDAFHGLHVHTGDATGRCEPATDPPFTNVGGHWTLGTETHGHHDGDLPPVLVQADGTGAAHATTARLDPGQVIGKAVVLHAGPDNLANIPTRYATGAPPVTGPDATTLGAGDAGGRLACGIISGD